YEKSNWQGGFHERKLTFRPYPRQTKHIRQRLPPIFPFRSMMRRNLDGFLHPGDRFLDELVSIGALAVFQRGDRLVDQSHRLDAVTFLVRQTEFKAAPGLLKIFEWTRRTLRRMQRVQCLVHLTMLRSREGIVRKREQRETKNGKHEGTFHGGKCDPW